jgi:hypothetical protein
MRDFFMASDFWLCENKATTPAGCVKANYRNPPRPDSENSTRSIQEPDVLPTGRPISAGIRFAAAWSGFVKFIFAANVHFQFAFRLGAA